MKITFLGTSAMLPTKERNTSSILLNYKNENILVDCGEGTQRQLRKLDISPTKITRILITHWHGDHVLGLPGLLQSVAKSDPNKEIKIYGPIGTKKFVSNILHSFNYEDKIKLEVNEIKSGLFLNEKEFEIYSQEVKHTAKCLAYSFKEKDRRKVNVNYTKKFGLTNHPLLGQLQKGKTITYEGKKITPEKGTTLILGKKITFVLDTTADKNLEKFANNSDLLISEATFTKDLKQKALEFYHMTSEQAAYLAKKSKSRKLVLTHFSQRNKTTKEIEHEAKKVFKNTKCAEDFLEVEV
ncbi:ribonuclease Z [Candidatus Woesearchaeota archaeon]|nr:ribonuclease Z [Candidatus Woesearchaeota archaeon]